MPVKGDASFITLEDVEAVIQARVAAYLAGIEDDEERRDAESDIRDNFTVGHRQLDASSSISVFL